MQILLNNSIEAYFSPSHRLVCCLNGDIRNYNSYFLEVTVSENFRLSPKQQTENCFFLFSKKWPGEILPTIICSYSAGGQNVYKLPTINTS